MKPLSIFRFLLICFSLAFISRTCYSATTLNPASLSVSVAPASATYTAGQSITVTVTGGTEGRDYALSLYDGDPNDINSSPTSDLDYLINSEDNQNNTLTWGAGQTSIWFVVRFNSPGTSRVLDVGNALNNEFADTELTGFTILPKPTLNISYLPSSTSYTIGQSITLTISGGIVGEKYVPLLYDGPAGQSNDITQYLVSLGNSQGNGNTINWTESSTTEQFFLRFNGGEGTGRILEVSNLDFNQYTDSEELTIKCPQVNISALPSLVLTEGGSITLTASGTDSFTWSANTGSATVAAISVNLTGVYSVTGSNGLCSTAASVTVITPKNCDPLQPAHAYSVTQTAVLGPDNCSVALTGNGFGTSYTLTGPNGYVFSTVYRNEGTYTIQGASVVMPGAYTYKVGNQNACGETSYDTITYMVTGQACR